MLPSTSAPCCVWTSEAASARARRRSIENGASDSGATGAAKHARGRLPHQSDVTITGDNGAGKADGGNSHDIGCWLCVSWVRSLTGACMILLHDFAGGSSGPCPILLTINGGDAVLGDSSSASLMRPGKTISSSSLFDSRLALRVDAPLFSSTCGRVSCEGLLGTHADEYLPGVVFTRLSIPVPAKYFWRSASAHPHLCNSPALSNSTSLPSSSKPIDPGRSGC